MKQRSVLVLAILCLALPAANAQSWLPPAEEDRCPSRWGEGDERGSANHMGPSAVLRAARLINSGEVVELGHELHESIPLGNRHFDLYLKPTGMNPQALADASLSLEPGDAVIIHTGWGQLWETDVPRFLGRAPGIGIAAAEWLVTQDPMLVGADNQPVEIQPNPDSGISLPVHQIMLVVNGIHLLERMKLDELAARQVYEFAFVMQPLKIRGATGSTVAPAAIY